MQNIPDDVLKKASKGDLGSFKIIYDKTAGFVYNVALRVLNSKEDAEEITQEVFLVVYKKLKDFRFESSLKTWIYRITVNRAVNMAKKKSREKMITAEYEKEVYVNSVKAVQERPGAETAQELLSALDPDQRACLALRSIEGLSYKEISNLLKVNINTVRSRLRRARERIASLGKVRTA